MHKSSVAAMAGEGLSSIEYLQHEARYLSKGLAKEIIRRCAKKQ